MDEDQLPQTISDPGEAQREPETGEPPGQTGSAWRDEEKPKWPARYGVGALVAAIGTMIVGGGFALAPVIEATGSHDFESDPIAIFAATLVQDAIFIFAAIGFASVAQPLARHLFGLRKVPLRKAFAWGALGVLVYVPVFLALLFLLADEPSIGEDTTTLGWVVIFVAIAVFPPISEEFLFRGFIFQAFRNRMNVVLAAGVSSLLFGIGHIQGFNLADGLVPVAWTMVFGMAMCMVFQKTKSLYPGMAIHALHNGTIVVLAATLS